MDSATFIPQYYHGRKTQASWPTTACTRPARVVW
jgi:hypothetical protein